LLFLLLFLKGVLEKEGVERGLFVVGSWWIAGETWCFDDRLSETKNMPLLLTIFLTFSTRQRSRPCLGRLPGSVNWR
jgi:hypothetical protein